MNNKLTKIIFSTTLVSLSIMSPLSIISCSNNHNEKPNIESMTDPKTGIIYTEQGFIIGRN